MLPLLFADHPQYWFETLRVLGHAAYSGADIGEVLAAAADIPSGDDDAWHRAWTAIGDRITHEAEEAERSGMTLSARDGFLRANTYYRTADFFLHADPTDPRIGSSFERGMSCFTRAAALFSEPTIVPVRIPYQGTELHGWFYRCARTEPGPVIVMHNGFDGSAEEMHFFGAMAAAERGFHVLTFDGPGQPSAAHRGLTFRPDWEHVVGPVIDHLLATWPDAVDPARIALLGVSLGGVLAPRAAAFDDRIAAVICNDGVYDALSAIASMLGTTREALEARWHDPDFDQDLSAAAATHDTLRWALDHGRWVFGTETPAEFVRAYAEFTLAGGVAERIRCPVLVAEAANDLFFPGDENQQAEPRRLYDHLRGPKTLMTFTAAEGAAAHCHVGAERLAAARMFNWLAQRLPHTQGTAP